MDPTLAKPAYDVAAQNIGIVHLGIGAFHRAHQAIYVDDCLAAGDRDWAILGASLRSPDTRDALVPQDGLYTALIRSAGRDEARVVGSVRRLLVAPEDPGALLEAMTDPAVRIVSLTVTEKGYCRNAATGALQEDHPDILHDLDGPTSPRSAIGFLVEALARRRMGGIAPFTVLCCDNLPQNGKTVRGLVVRFAEMRDAELARFIATEVTFPCTMVDRIVPATTDADREVLADTFGISDAWPVATEAFSQWVVEDRFCNGRPHFEAVGVQMVAEAAPYEAMKLRLLNGSHSAIAYLGYLAGHETVADAIGAPGFATFVRGLMDLEVTPTLEVPAEADLESYKAALLSRFANPSLRHRTWQIAMDGSQKLPQRLLDTVRERLASGGSIDRLALAVAAWMRYATGRDERGEAIDLRDPLAQRLIAIDGECGGDAARLAAAFLGIREVFGSDLPAAPRFVAEVTKALAGLLEKGAARIVAEFPE
ncbi:MAG: mannitol dehydrogenase family protein [Candidatus Kaistia colombiensis]|nr:MAG: mannitol dehydrogenase family protein [Kaistia sp.]